MRSGESPRSCGPTELTRVASGQPVASLGRSSPRRTSGSSARGHRPARRGTGARPHPHLRPRRRRGQHHHPATRQDALHPPFREPWRPARGHRHWPSSSSSVYSKRQILVMDLNAIYYGRRPPTTIASPGPGSSTPTRRPPRPRRQPCASFRRGRGSGSRPPRAETPEVTTRALATRRLLPSAVATRRRLRGARTTRPDGHTPARSASRPSRRP